MRSIPKRYEDVKYEDAPEGVRNYFEKIRETRKGLYIYGPIGTGKTHIAFALKKKWDETSRYSADFWNTSELMQEIKDDFDRDNYSKTHRFEKMMDEKGVIFLDDIGSEKLTEWVLERFYLIINKKYNDMLPIIFTSNYSIEDLAARVGDRIASRIVEMCDIIKTDGEDRRIK